MGGSGCGVVLRNGEVLAYKRRPNPDPQRLISISPPTVQISALHSTMSFFRTSRLLLAGRPALNLTPAYRIPCVFRHKSTTIEPKALITQLSKSVVLPEVDNELVTDHGTRYVWKLSLFQLCRELLTMCHL